MQLAYKFILLDLPSTPKGSKKVSNLEIIIILLNLLSAPRGTKIFSKWKRLLFYWTNSSQSGGSEIPCAVRSVTHFI